MDMATNLDMWSGSFKQTVAPQYPAAPPPQPTPHPKLDLHEIWLIGPVVSEENMFENVDDDEIWVPWTNVKEWPWPPEHVYLHVLV